MGDHEARLKLVVDNSGSVAGSRSFLGKVPLELLERRSREPPSSLNSGEELAVIDYQHAKARLGDLALFAEARGIIKKLVLEGHLSPMNFSNRFYEGFFPQSSSGNFPHESAGLIGDNSLVSGAEIAERIFSRAEELGTSANAVCLAANLDRSFASNLRTGNKKRSLTVENLLKLAEQLKCRVEWLATGIPPVDYSGKNETIPKTLVVMQNLPPEAQVQILTIAEAFQAREQADQRESDRAVPESD